MGVIDDVTKKYIGRNDKFADIFNYYVFHGEQVIRPEELDEKDSTELEVVFGKGKSASTQKMRDLLRKLIFKYDGNTVYMLAGVENQTDIHYAMVIKNMLYDTLNYASQVENIAYEHDLAKDLKGAEFLSGFAKADRLIPVVTIVIYWSSAEWDGARSLHEMFDVQDQQILKYVPDYKINLIIPHDIEDFSKFKTELNTVFKFISVSNDKEDLKDFCEDFKDIEISREAANLLNVAFNAHIDMRRDEGGKVKMCKGLEDWAAESKEKGKIEGRIEILTSLIDDGLLSKEDAAYRAGMSIEKFEEIMSMEVV